MPMGIVPDGYSPSREYHPGDQITGTVLVAFQKQQTILSAQICFQGRIETGYLQHRSAVGTPTNEHGSETIQLFELKQTLSTGPYDVQPQSLEWAFAFTIPTYVNCRRTGNGLRGFIGDGVSLLPPSLSWNSTSFWRDAHAYIVYKLVATIDAGDMFKSHRMELPIRITRLSQSIHPPLSPQMTAHEYHPPPKWSSRALRAQGLSLKDTLRLITSNDPELQTPCISFKAYVHFPTSLSPKQKTSIAFSTTPLRITPNDPEAPNLTLKTLSLTLKSHTVLVIPESAKKDRLLEDHDHEAGYDLLLDPMILPLDGSEVILREGICLAEWRPYECWKGNFCTYTVKRDHYMKVDATIQHADTGHVFRLSTEFPFCLLDIHPEEMQSRQLLGGLAGSDVGEGDYHGHGNVDVELDHPPPYDADVRPPDHQEEWRILQQGTSFGQGIEA